jgi:hypothetical protein
MKQTARARAQALSEQLNEPPRSPGTFEDIPQLPVVAGNSAGP